MFAEKGLAKENLVGNDGMGETFVLGKLADKGENGGYVLLSGGFNAEYGHWNPLPPRERAARNAGEGKQKMPSLLCALTQPSPEERGLS
jgi:hypothetical protein